MQNVMLPFKHCVLPEGKAEQGYPDQKLQEQSQEGK